MIYFRDVIYLYEMVSTHNDVLSNRLDQYNISQEFVVDLVEAYPLVLEYVPYQYKTQTMCDSAVSKDQYRSSEMCQKAGKKLDKKKYIIKMSFKFGQITITSKDFHKKKQITDINTIDLDRIIVSDPLSCNNGKDRKYIIGYETDAGITALYIKTPKNIFSPGVKQYNENSPYTMGFDLDEHKNWLEQYKKNMESCRSTNI